MTNHPNKPKAEKDTVFLIKHIIHNNKLAKETGKPCNWTIEETLEYLRRYRFLNSFGHPYWTKQRLRQFLDKHNLGDFE